MTGTYEPRYCGACGEVFGTGALLDEHQLATSHELDQPDHPLHVPAHNV